MVPGGPVLSLVAPYGSVPTYLVSFRSNVTYDLDSLQIKKYHIDRFENNRPTTCMHVNRCTTNLML